MEIKIFACTPNKQSWRICQTNQAFTKRASVEQSTGSSVVIFTATFAGIGDNLSTTSKSLGLRLIDVATGQLDNIHCSDESHSVLSA